MGAKEIQAGLRKLHEKIRSGKEISEEDVRVAFVKTGLLEELGYAGELKDVVFEKAVKGKRSDLLAFDDYKNVVFVVEFKKPEESNLDEHFAQLWERYVRPLKARYGLLTNGLELLVYERINSNWDKKFKTNLAQVNLQQCEDIYDWLKKPKIERTRVDEVLEYFGRFDIPVERINLSSEIAQKHFFDSFELKEGSVFVDLLRATIGLFDSELERSMFLKSAYDFWKTAYAKKPEKIPENWRRIIEKIGLEANEENLFKFMFCLESAYSLFTRLILAKACEDYKLPYVDFSEFVKGEIKRIAYRGDITLLAILNSHITNFYIWHVGVVHGSGYYKFEDRFIKGLPIRLPEKAEQKLAGDITKKVAQILKKVKIEQKIEKFPDEYVQEYRSKSAEFDYIEITFNSDHKSIEPLIEETIDGGFNVLIGKNEKPIFIDSKVKANYVIASLKGKSAKKNEKIHLLVSKSEAIAQEILRKLEEDKAETKSPSVAELEHGINELIYKLYGLNADDVKVIEEFLERF